MENRKPVDFKEIPEERWMEVDWGKEPAVEYDFSKIQTKNTFMSRSQTGQLLQS